MRAMVRLKAKWEKEILMALAGFRAIMKSMEVRERPFMEVSMSRSPIVLDLNYLIAEFT